MTGMEQFKDKIVLVTGAARGLGRSIAEKFAGRGAHVAVCDLNREWLADTEKAITGLGRQALALAADVSNPEHVQAALETVVQQFGRLDVMVNNAGITKDGFLVRMSEADWDAVININLKGTFLFTKQAAKVMMKQKSGAIVNVASIIGLIGNAGQANYGASKAGVIALTKSAARELASRNIRINAVAPGFIETRMTEVLPEAIRQKMLAAIPLGRFGRPEDVANVVLFLAGQDAAYMTGQVLTISGGMVM